MDNAVILKIVDDIRRDERGVGTRKLKDRLEKKGRRVGRDALFALLRSHGKLVKPVKSYQKTTYSRHSYVVAPNRIKGLEITRAKQVVVSDITYLRLGRNRFAYLFLVSDLYSRKILGFHVSRDLSHYSALIALEQAVENLDGAEGTIHHSDRGCQYCCHEYLRYLDQHGMLPSMTDESHCYQNAVAERINGILKIDLGLDDIFDNITQAQRAAAHAVLVYNTRRTHWSLGLQTPAEVYDRAA